MKVFILLISLAFVCAQMAGGYKDLDVREAQSSVTLMQLLDFGEQEFVRKAFEENKISDPNLTFAKLLSVSQQVVAGLNVKYNTEFVDAQGQVYFVTFVVFYQPWTNTKELLSYNIDKIPQF